MNARLLVALVLLAGCTTMRDDSRRTLGWLDASLTPGSPGARGALLPVAIPIGFTGLVCDTVVVNPVCAVDDAWGDTVDVLWTSSGESGLRRALFVPLAALGTPFVFAGDWLWRSIVPTAPRAADAVAPPRPAPQEKKQP
jgi:hypothetical protein